MKSKKSSKRYALVIASPYGNLKGTTNDANSMTRVLERHGFIVVRCCGAVATRANILREWHLMIRRVKKNDAVVIYYTGHGGLVESERNPDATPAEGSQTRRYQFIYPVDFEESVEGDFHGILDVELSHLLNKTTDKSKNTTVIFDCCHSARMARDARHGDKARPRGLPQLRRELSGHVQRLISQRTISSDLDMQGNPFAVRVVAAASKETAWEYDYEGQTMGVFTKTLCDALNDAATSGSRISWKTTMIWVCQAVNAEFPLQHPHTDGPHDRVHFSLEIKPSDSLHFRVRDGFGYIESGRFAGMEVGNEFGVMKPRSEAYIEVSSLAKVQVTQVFGFESTTDYESDRVIPEGSLAFLLSEMPYRWPAFVPQELARLRAALNKSKFLRPRALSDKEPWIVRFREDSGQLRAYTSDGIVVACQDMRNRGRELEISNDFIKKAERLARAQHLLSMQGGLGDEELEHNLDIKLIKISGSCGILLADGNGAVNEGQSVRIELRNRGNKTVFVSVLDVNVAGDIQLLPGGDRIEILPDRDHVIGRSPSSTGKGLELAWPREIKDRTPVNETLVFVISDAEVDFRVFVDQRQGSRDVHSRLGRLADQLACGSRRDFVETGRLSLIRFDVIHLPFKLYPQRAKKKRNE